MAQMTSPQTPDDAALARPLIPECTISDERASQLKEWLRNNSQPLSQIETYMENTAVYRAKWIRDNSWTIDQILEEFPCLMTKGMIAQDFLVLHGDAASKLFETWLPIYAEKVLYLAKQEGKLTLPLHGLTPDGVGELALRQLPGLLPPTTYKVGRGRGVKVVRYTNRECSLAFIDHKAPGINMVEYLHEAKVSKPYPHVLMLDSPRSTLTVTLDSPVFTGETVNLTCVIESHSDWRRRNGLTNDWRFDRRDGWTDDWRYEWYKGTDSVMLQWSDRYTVNRDTLTIRGATESDQGQYWCRGQRDKRPQSSQSSSAVKLTVIDVPTSKVIVTPKTIFTGETVNLKCVIESNHRDWRYEWYKDSVMLKTSDGYTVNRDTLTIRGATESDQGQYWCRGQRDERPSSSQESNQINLSVNVSAASSSLLVTGVVLGLLCLLIFISLLLLWRYKKNKDQQRNINQTSVPNQSGESQPENSPLQSDPDHIYEDVTEVNKRRKDDPESYLEITYSEVTVQKKISVDKDDSMAESNEVTYSEVRTKVKKCKSKDADAGVGDATYALIRKKGP